MGVECDVSSLLDEYPALCDQLQGSVDLGLDLEFAIVLPKDDAAVLEVQERLKPRSEEVDWPLQRKRLPAPKKKGMKRERPLSEDSDNDDADADRDGCPEDDDGDADKSNKWDPSKPYERWTYRHEIAWANAPVARIPSTMPLLHPRHAHHKENNFYTAMTPRYCDCVLLNEAYDNIEVDGMEAIINLTRACCICCCFRDSLLHACCVIVSMLQFTSTTNGILIVPQCPTRLTGAPTLESLARVQ